MSSNGAISWDEFITGSESLMKIIKNWKLVEAMDIPGGKYLESSTLRTFSDLKGVNDKTGVRDKDHNHDMRIIQQECHIVYSLSHSVPVFYFNMSFADGSRLSMEQILTCLKIDVNESYSEKNNALTQGEHPILHVPYIILHPCHTNELMKSVPVFEKRNKSSVYLLSWLSVVSSRLGFPLSSVDFLELQKISSANN